MGQGGGVAEVEQFIQSLTGRGMELHFLIPRPRGDSELKQDRRITCHTYPDIFHQLRFIPGAIRRFLLPAFFYYSAKDHLLRLASEIEPDLVMGFSHHALPPLNRLGHSTGIPTVAKLFGVMYLGRFDLPPLTYWWKSLEQLMVLKWPVDHYIVMNDGTRGEEALRRAGIPEKKISMLPNGMNTEWADLEVDRAEIRREMKLPPGDILVITLSRLVKSKRIDLFLQAAARMCKKGCENVTFVIGGDGPEREKLEQLAGRLNLKEKIVFTGTIPHHRVAHLLKACDIFVGTNELTNMSLPPCEAILCGVPVVAFDVSGTSEVVKDGYTGLLVEHHHVEALAAGINTLATDHRLREKLSRGAEEFGRKHFVSWNRRIQMELDILEDIMGNPGDK